MKKYFKQLSNNENNGVVICVDDALKITLLAHNVPNNVGLSAVKNEELDTTQLVEATPEEFKSFWNNVNDILKLV